MGEYKDSVAFAYKDYPLNTHAHSQKAAEATHCAEAQGRFWDYHRILFVSKQLDPASLKAQARDLGLDANGFDKCLDGGEKADIVTKELSEAQALGLQGTPTFFVNGRYVTGALTYERLRGMIEEELNASPSQAASTSPQRARQTP
jgi:protein-disulfide isomerase